MWIKLIFFFFLGINKHLNILLLQEKMNHELKRHIPTKSIWKYLESKWNIQAAVITFNLYNCYNIHFIIIKNFRI